MADATAPAASIEPTPIRNAVHCPAPKALANIAPEIKNGKTVEPEAI
jgi:hypothetical protein